MSEAKIPARWQDEYGLAKNEYCDALTVQLIEELGAAEQERDKKSETISELSRLAASAGREITRLKDEVERLKGDYNVLLDDCIDMRSELAQVRRYDKD